MNTYKVWNSLNENDWFTQLDKYWTFVKPTHLEIEKKFNDFDAEIISKMDKKDWFNFLHDEYFKWKFTAANRFASTTKHLKKYLGPEDNLDILFTIKQAILKFDKNNIKLGLEIVQQIRGLGTAGASGLLSILYPNYFATVDQFVVKALSEVNNLQEGRQISKMSPINLTINDGVILIQIMREKAQELNNKFSTEFWTPRKLDMVLWVSSRNDFQFLNYPNQFSFKHPERISNQNQTKNEIKPKNQIKNVEMNNKTITKDDSSLTSKMLSLFDENSTKVFTRKEIIDKVLETYPGTNSTSVIPSDYCYNITNKGIQFKTHLFEFLGAGYYRCLGKNHRYSGDILWKGEKVGEWENGVYKLWKDPRK